ncbi:cytokine receptor common subunit beta [Solea solea]|uniref:cytokine receptor common subunit beta n=1 Tax=Solea solea TaxID=90069 RepID=UPI00272B2D91|nr:cytokine receptor common subunit beta [Solea solea]
MMSLFWVVLWTTLPLPALFSGPQLCSIDESNTSNNTSTLLESLQCYNNYQSYVHCNWRQEGDAPLQLWFKTEHNRMLCVPYSLPSKDSDQGMVQCRHKTHTFSIGVKHTVFFQKINMPTVCSSVPHKPVSLSQHLRAHPPVDLSTHDSGDGGRWLTWSCPYPSSSSLNKKLTYQLSYQPQKQDHWTTVDVTNTSVKLQRHLLLPGHTYEARVRARASVGQWSHWSPVVSWRCEENTGQFPRLHCVLDSEKEVTCSWEVSRELASFITYQLACQHNQTAPSERCCVSPTVVPHHNRTLRFSCSLTVADPARLLLELHPTHTAKTFKAHQHIRPEPPQQVNVKKKQSSWIVEWTESSTATKVKLFYQVCYYRSQDQGCSLLNMSEGSTSLTLQEASLIPSQHYKVKVRSLVVPGHGSRYEGLPSEWTHPKDWVSNAATWSFTTIIYVLISVVVTAVFFSLYFTIPACRRRIIVWVDSVPSPGKSKILSEIQATTMRTLQSEVTSICKVLHFDSVFTCSSDASLLPNTNKNKKCMEPDEGFWNDDNSPARAEEVNTSGSSSVSFSGPYIFCQGSSESNHKPVDVEYKEEEEDRTRSDPFTSPVNFSSNRGAYVCLPNHSISRSTQDLVSSSVANTNADRSNSAEQDQQQCPDTMTEAHTRDFQPGLSEVTGRDQPLAYTSGPFTSWPHGGTVQASGYCHLPQHQ